MIRVESYTRGALAGIGAEQCRTESSECRNTDIDSKLTSKNFAIKEPAGKSLTAAWHIAQKTIGTQAFVDRKNAIAAEQLLVTAAADWFEEKFGWHQGEGLTPELRKYFEDSYAWAVSQIGYHGGDENILAATIHLDEKAPHMHITYLPVTDRWREKSYAKAPDGKTLRNGRGSPIAVKGPDGKTAYREVIGQPKISRSEFWRLYAVDRGGSNQNQSYSLLQDSYHDSVGIIWGLERGEVGSDRRHRTHHQERLKRAEEKVAAAEEKVAAEEAKVAKAEKDAVDKIEMAESETVARLGELPTDADKAVNIDSLGKRSFGGVWRYTEAERAQLIRLARLGSIREGPFANVIKLTQENADLKLQIGEVKYLRNNLIDTQQRLANAEAKLDEVQDIMYDQEKSIGILGRSLAAVGALVCRIIKAIRLPEPLQRLADHVADFVSAKLLAADLQSNKQYGIEPLEQFIVTNEKRQRSKAFDWER